MHLWLDIFRCWHVFKTSCGFVTCCFKTYSKSQVVIYCQNIFNPAKPKTLLIVVSCSGKLHSVSLQLRGHAANSRAPSWRPALPDYASTSHWSPSNTHTDEVSLQAFHLFHHSAQCSWRKICVCGRFRVWRPTPQHFYTFKFIFVNTFNSSCFCASLCFSIYWLWVWVVSWRHSVGEEDGSDARIWTGPLKPWRVVSGQTPCPQHTQWWVQTHIVFTRHHLTGIRGPQHPPNWILFCV